MTSEEAELKELDCAFWSIMKFKSFACRYIQITKAVQMWWVSLKNPEQWWCLREIWKIGCTLEIYWKDNEINNSNCRSFSFSTLCTEVFTLINSLPTYDSFNSIPSHCFHVLEHWLQSYYFGLQSRLSVLWRVQHLYQISPLEWQNRVTFHFSKLMWLKTITSTPL